MTKELGQIVYKSSMMTHDSDRLFVGVPMSNDKAMEAVNRLLKEERIITQYKRYFLLLENRKMEGTLRPKVWEMLFFGIEQGKQNQSCDDEIFVRQ